MTNPGVVPVDSTTLVGQLRYLIGDIDFTPLTDSTGDFTNFSDAQLQSYLDLAASNLGYAAGYAYRGIAAQAAAQAINVKTSDEQIDLTKRAAELRQIADDWFARADIVLQQEAAAYHQIIQPEYQTDDDWPPELATPIIDLEWWH